MHRAFFPAAIAMTDCLIDPVRLSALLGRARGRVDAEVLAECDSSNSVLLERAAHGAPSGAVVIAERQTAGRGRRGRVWRAAAGDSLTFSLLWRFGGDISRLAGLSLAVGVALARALESCGVRGVALKWPNDLLLDGGKLGGVLIELASERGATAAVIGIGINLQPPLSNDGFALPAASLAGAGFTPDCHVLLAALLDSLIATLDVFVADGFAALREDWQARHVWQGLPVRLLDSANGENAAATVTLAEGICLGAAADGALILATADGGQQRFLVGDVSLRAA
ncbi:biotin--[acetyl-CoA-carboxylase] ligase [Rhodocyclus tenuis]|uniref:biotin--[acetyl-CoA-carboxylase] ligase n=1 Tax=Rhodocyclus tenuis TaxID=1066 RepID=UPI001F5B63F5|nr:biotin--[acetyl-CoA-carboxylase] ligase [Rhodocyclus tenuis]